MRGKGRVAEKGGLFWAKKRLCNQIRFFFPGEMGGEGREKEEGKGFTVPSKSLNKVKPNPSELKICEIQTQEVF